MPVCPIPRAPIIVKQVTGWVEQGVQSVFRDDGGFKLQGSFKWIAAQRCNGGRTMGVLPPALSPQVYNLPHWFQSFLFFLHCKHAYYQSQYSCI